MDNYSSIDSTFIKENEWIIKKALSKYSWLTNYEDILQEARIWLCKAKLRYSPKRASWPTYAQMYIYYEYKNYVRCSKVKGKSAQNEGYSCVGLEVLTDQTLYKNNIISNDSFDIELFFNSALDSLEEGRNKDVVILVTLGFTYREIGKRYNISCQRIKQIYDSQIEKIKGYIT